MFVDWAVPHAYYQLRLERKHSNRASTWEYDNLVVEGTYSLMRLGKLRSPAWLLVLPAIILFLRSPQQFFLPQFYAEDGALFYKEAWDFGFLATLLRPTEGYLNTYPRIAAAIAQFFPLAAGPLILTIFGLLLKLIPVAYLLSDRAAKLMPRLWMRFALGLIYVVVPNAESLHGNITNSQWNLAPAACLVLLCTPPAAKVGKAVDAAILALFALTGPTAILFLPVTVILLWQARRGESRAWRTSTAGILFAGAAVQIGVFVTHLPTHRFSSFSSALRDLSLNFSGAQLLHELAGHTVFMVLLGKYRYYAWESAFGPALNVAGLLLLVVLAAVLLKIRALPLLLLFYLGFATITVALILPSHHLYFAERYHFYSTLFIVFAAARLAFTRRLSRIFGILLSAPILLLAIPGDFSVPLDDDLRFRDQVAIFAALPPMSSFDMPILPRDWNMRLKKQAGAPVAQNPFVGLPILQEDAGLSVNDISRTRLDGGADEDFFLVSGYAYDPTTGRRAGGILVVAGGRIYPASYGLRLPLSKARKQGIEELEFRRAFPRSSVGKGAPWIDLYVLTPDQKRFYRPVRLSLSLSA